MAPFMQSGVTMVGRWCSVFLISPLWTAFSNEHVIRKTMSVEEKHLTLCVFKRNLTNVKRPSTSRRGAGKLL